MIELPELTLLVLPVWILGVALVGETLVWLIGYLAHPSEGSGAIGRLSLVERAIWDLALGTCGLALIAFLFEVGPVPLDPATSAAILLVPGVLLLVRFWKRWESTARRISQELRSQRWEILALLLVFALSLGARLWPYGGAYLYAGNDIRIYTFYTQRTLATGHLAVSLGPLLMPGWLATPELHQYFVGSEGIFAIVNLWLPIPTPQLTSAVTILYNALVPLSVYALGRALFRDRPWWVPMTAAGLMAVVSTYPLSFLSWGGIDETIGWAVLPVALAVFILLLEVGPANRPLWIAATLFVGGLGVISPISVVYVLTFLVAFVAERLIRRQATPLDLVRLFSPVAAGLVVISPVILQGLSAWSESAKVSYYGIGGWGDFQSGPIFQYGQWESSAVRFLTNSTNLDTSAIVVLLGWIGLVLVVRSVRYVPTLLIWCGLLILVNENGPYGLYWIRFPGWNDLFPARPADLLFVPLSIGTALLLYRLTLWARSPGSGASGGLPSATDPRPPGGAETSPPSIESVNPVPHSRGTSLRRRSSSLRGLGALLGIGAVLALCVVASFSLVEATDVAVPWARDVTPQDVTAFDWMQAHLPAGATVLVDTVDAGTWIPAFTDLRAFPDLQLINNFTLYNDYESMISQMFEYNYSLYATLVRQYGIEAAYFGASPEYSGWINLPPSRLLNPPYIWNYVTNDTLCVPPKEQFSINLGCNNDSVTLVGPIAYSVTVWQNLAPVGTYNGTVPAGYRFTFVLHEYTAKYWGNWDATFVSQPLATVEYQVPGSSAEVLGLNPAYAATSCTVVPLSSCQP